MFELRAVLSASLSRVALRTVDPRPERTVRRAVTLVPGNGAEVISGPADGSSPAVADGRGGLRRSAQGRAGCRRRRARHGP